MHDKNRNLIEILLFEYKIKLKYWIHYDINLITF